MLTSLISIYRWSPASRASPLAFSSRALLSSVSLQWRFRTLACDSSAASCSFPFGSTSGSPRLLSRGPRMHSPLPLATVPSDVHILWPTGATQAGQPVRRRLAPPALSSPCSAGPASSPGCTTTACATSSVQSRRPPRRLARSAQKSRARLVWVRVVGLGLGSGLGLKVGIGAGVRVRRGGVRPSSSP